jgi:hypothetical protein
MTDPHVTIEFVGGPLCGAVVDSRKEPLRAADLRRVLSVSQGDNPAELQIAEECPDRPHRYRLLVELGFGSRVLFRAEYAGR